MRYLILLASFIFINGCTDVPTPQDQKELLAQQTIEKNMNEAQKAKEEYLALQEKRRREGTL